LSNIHLVIPDQHAVPGQNNNRADWLGKLILDLRPTTVVNLGDMADMPSLCSYDKGKKSFYGRSYRQDIDAHLDFQDRLWHPIRRAKKKLPRRIALEGNHEERIKRALEQQPELEGTISGDDLRVEDFYDTYVEYDGATPGTIEVDGILYAHYLVGGVAARSISSDNQANAILSKYHTSCTVGHIHTFDYTIRVQGNGRKIMGLSAGVYQSHTPSFAGKAAQFWHRGVVVKRGVDNGVYDLEFISIQRLKKLYG
jgi:hypothetical protein